MSKRWLKPLLAGIALLASTGSVLYVINQSSANAGGPVPAAGTGLGSVVAIPVPVTDLAVAQDFYVNRMGFTVGGPAGSVVPPKGGAVLLLTQGSGALPPGAERGLGIRTIDCAGDVATLRSRGVNVPDCWNGPGGPMTQFPDPDGNLWTLAGCGGDQTVGVVSNISIPVVDQNNALDFYVRGLGFTVLNDRPNPDGYPGRWLELAPPTGSASVTLNVWDATMPAGSMQGVGIGTADCAATVAALRANGVPVSDCSPAGTATVNDPAGNTWTITQSTPV